MTVHGVLEDETVRVREESSADRLRDKGAYGTREGDELVLDLHEAAYLVEADRLSVETPDGAPVSGGQLLARGSQGRERFETEHLVYRDYRSRGYVARRGEDELDAWERGAQPPRQNPSTVLCPRAAADETTPEDLLDKISRSHGLGRGLLWGIVDEESDVTYYEADLATVTGTVDDPAPERGEEARLRLLRDRAILHEAPGALVHAGYGHEAGEHRFASLAEAWHLARHGARLEAPDGALAEPETLEARVVDEHGGTEVLEAYAWMRERGLAPKTGFKFGVHYRVYDEAPGDSHAPYLVQARPSADPFTFRELARFVRLTHSVRKKPILWTPEGAVMTPWTRP